MSPVTVPRLAPLPASFTTTVTMLHRVAEQIVAPARKPDNEIALASTRAGSAPLSSTTTAGAGRCASRAPSSCTSAASRSDALR